MIARNESKQLRCQLQPSFAFVLAQANMSSSIIAEYEKSDYTEEFHSEAPPAAASSASGSALRLNVACMSRAGREPGFKKTNQDNCFAFEKYITEDQSLFGAMDGHGPHGHLVSGYIKQHLPIILVNHLSQAVSDPETKAALTRGFLEVDKGLRSSRIDCEFSGSTCVVAFLKVRPAGAGGTDARRCRC